MISGNDIAIFRVGNIPDQLIPGIQSFKRSNVIQMD
jgi:hypothetical protein